jgi:hypothetical protein
MEKYAKEKYDRDSNDGFPTSGVVRRYHPPAWHPQVGDPPMAAPGTGYGDAAALTWEAAAPDPEPPNRVWTVTYLEEIIYHNRCCISNDCDPRYCSSTDCDSRRRSYTRRITVPASVTKTTPVKYYGPAFVDVSDPDSLATYAEPLVRAGMISVINAVPE